MPDPISIKTFNTIASSPGRVLDNSVAAGCAFLIVDCSKAVSTPVNSDPLNTILIGFCAAEKQAPAFDLLTDNPETLSTLCSAITAQPEAAYLLTQVLRHNEHTDPEQGLFAESLAYSTLQSGGGFQTWLRQQVTRTADKNERPPLLVERDGSTLNLQFNRPEYHNAYNAALKDALCEALELAKTDPSITGVNLSGRGPSFCAGGDLSEFGLSDNPSTAHASRTSRNAGRLLSGLSGKTSAYLHGACIGAGIELPAFCQHLTAHPDTFFQLPEVAMGLIPGAGGTVSILQRIGRHKTALMAISHEKIDAGTAFRWGLIDSITSEPGFNHPS